jgi:hypothetical protein
MKRGSFRENFDRRLCSFVEKEFRAPIEIILLARMHAGGAFIFAHGIERIAEPLVEIAK